jgi:hypothetical protein
MANKRKGLLTQYDGMTTALIGVGHIGAVGYFVGENW